tara:strand:- start:149 stop:637 length:489 start_codon:yes stop_codon:yes gene_type:complete
MRIFLILNIIFLTNLAYATYQSDYLSDKKIYLPEDSLSGTYLICVSKKEPANPREVMGFKFQDKKVFGYSIRIKKNKAQIQNWTPADIGYVTRITTDTVTWWNFRYALNRETLILDDGANNRRQCEVQPNDLAYATKIEEHRKDLQILLNKEISERTKNNKI